MSDLRKEIFLRGWQRNVPLPLLLLIWSYFNRLRRRFLAVVAKVRAGTLPAPRQPSAPTGDLSGPVPAREAWKLPREFGWLVKLLGPQPRYCATRLHFMLHDPDMKALLAKAPQLCRLLRPIFWALKERPARDLLAPPPSRTRRTSPRPRAPREPRAAPIARETPASAQAASPPAAPPSPPAPVPAPDPERWRPARPPGAGISIFRD